VQTAYLLPTYADKKFPAGRMVDMVVGFHNEGSETYNVSLIAGSLNSPADFSLHVQNFTMAPFGEVIGPGEEVSVNYKFTPDSRAPPRDFVVALTAFYSDSKGQWYSSTFFNQTVDIVEVKKMVDWELVSLVAIFAASLVGIAWALHWYVVSKGWLKPQKKRSKSKAPVNRGPVDPEEWTKGSEYERHMARLRQRKEAGTKVMYMEQVHTCMTT
jgi:translocon-associated protein subunit alpha